MKLSPNFSLAEMTKSETASRRGMDNIPNQEQITNMQVLAVNVLQKVRDHYGRGVHVNSGFRHPDVNAAVGGSLILTRCGSALATLKKLVDG
jgi:zinc D-Ala-D-Ala carboxypeptidase